MSLVIDNMRPGAENGSGGPDVNVKLPDLNSYRAATEKERAAAVSKYLTRLLHSSSDKVSDLLTPLDVNGVYLSSGCFLLAAFSIEKVDSSCPFKTYDEIYEGLIRYISNSFAPRCLNTATEVSGQIVMIVNYLRMNLETFAGSAKVEADICRSCEKLIEEVETKYSIELTANVSTIFEGYELLPDVYSTLYQCMEYRRFLTPFRSGVLSRAQMVTGSQISNNCIENINELVSCIRKNDSAAYTAETERTFDSLLRSPPFSLAYLYTRIQAFVHEFAKELAVQQVNSLNAVSEAHATNVLCSACSAEELHAAFIEFCDGVMSSYLRLNSSADSDLVEAAKAFITANICNPALSSTMVADALSVRRIYLSSVFSSVTGTYLSDYIHIVRLSHAENLMLESDMTIQEISEAAGYGSITTMHRAFQRFHQTSPAKYRSYLRANSVGD